jgi:hypothetical protein
MYMSLVLFRPLCACLHVWASHPVTPGGAGQGLTRRQQTLRPASPGYKTAQHHILPLLNIPHVACWQSGNPYCWWLPFRPAMP